MQLIPMSKTPNQSFVFKVGGNSYDLTIRCISDGDENPFMVYTLKIDGEPVVDSFRVTAGEMLVPYPYQERNGNLIIDMQRGQRADFRQFGDTQHLYYLNADEVRVYRGRD